MCNFFMPTVVGLFLPGVIKCLSIDVLCVCGKMVSNPCRQVVVDHVRQRSQLQISVKAVGPWNEHSP